MKQLTVVEGAECINQGGVIIYPTETVYGLGCRVNCLQAISRIIDIKRRSPSKGLIVLISEIAQLAGLTPPPSMSAQSLMSQYWPGPYTLLLPVLPDLPNELTGQFATIAIRMTSHPVAKALAVSSPIVSTSANISGEDPANDLDFLTVTFKGLVDGIVWQGPSVTNTPSRIIDTLTGKILR